MKIHQIIVNEMTTAGAVATVAKPLGEVEKRNPVKGLQPAEKVIAGKAKKKGPYANSIVEGKPNFMGKLQKKVDKSNKEKKETEEKVKQHQDQKVKDKVEEAKLDEDDLIIVPGHGMKRKTGFVPHGQSRVDHEVEMARSDVLATMKNAKAIYELLKSKTEDEGLEGWVQEKLIKANDYLNSVKEYYDEKMPQEMTGGVIAGGGVGESTDYPFNPDDPRNWAKKKAYDNRMAIKKEKELEKSFQQLLRPKPEPKPKLTYDQVWRKVEDVVSQVFPDGDPYDWLVPWFKQQGVSEFKIGEILDRAAKKNGYEDVYDYYDSMKDMYGKDSVAEGLVPGQAAWKKEMTTKGAVRFKLDQHGGGAVDRIVAYDKDGKVVGGFNRKGVAEAAKWRRDDLEGKTWRSRDWDDGDLSPDKRAIDKFGKDVDDTGDELHSRPGVWRGKADMSKRMTKKGTPTKSELGFQNNLKMRIKMKNKEGGLTGPQGVLPESQVDEKAVSKAQQRFFGAVHAAQKGEKAASPEIAKVAKSMTKKAAHDYASTKHKGLPEKVKKD